MPRSRDVEARVEVCVEASTSRWRPISFANEKGAAVSILAAAATTPTSGPTTPIAPVVPKITPDGSLPGGVVIGHLLNGLASWALYACLFAFLLGATIWAFSVRAGNFTQAHKGRDLLLGGLIGALVTGAASVIVHFAFTTGSAVQ